MSKIFSLPLLTILGNASDGCKIQLRRKSVISFSRKWIHKQCISTLGTREGHLVKQRKFIPLSSIHKEIRVTDLVVPNRGFMLPVELRNINKKKEHSEKILFRYSMEQLFNLVADVEHYKNFVPYCTNSVVTSRHTPDHLAVDFSIGFPPFLVESCTNNFTLTSPSMVKSVCLKGKLFNHLVTIWKFSPGPNGNPDNCIVDFYLSFELRSLFHSQLSRMFFNKVVQEMVTAFSAEAKRRYVIRMKSAFSATTFNSNNSNTISPTSKRT